MAADVIHFDSLSLKLTDEHEPHLLCYILKYMVGQVHKPDADLSPALMPFH